MGLYDNRKQAALSLHFMRQRTRWGQSYWLYQAGRWSALAEEFVKEDASSRAQVKRILEMHTNLLAVTL